MVNLLNISIMVANRSAVTRLLLVFMLNSTSQQRRDINIYLLFSPWERSHFIFWMLRSLQFCPLPSTKASEGPLSFSGVPPPLFSLIKSPPSGNASKLQPLLVSDGLWPLWEAMGLGWDSKGLDRESRSIKTVSRTRASAHVLSGLLAQYTHTQTHTHYKQSQ